MSEASGDRGRGAIPGDPATDRPGAAPAAPGPPEPAPEPETVAGEAREAEPASAGGPDEQPEGQEPERDERRRLEAELERVSGERDQYIEALQRLKAEFDNFRRRSERERQANAAAAARELVRDLLPVMDNLERAVAALEEHGEGMTSGLEMVRAQLAGVLAGQGVEEIEALGREFDPNVHDAIAQLPADDAEAGTVIEVVEKGYRQSQTVLRPTKVVVAAQAQ